MSICLGSAERVHLFGTLKLEQEANSHTDTRIISPEQLQFLVAKKPKLLQFRRSAINRNSVSFTIVTPMFQQIRMQTHLHKFRGLRLTWDNFFYSELMELWQVPTLEIIDPHLVKFQSLSLKGGAPLCQTDLSNLWLKTLLALLGECSQKAHLHQPVVCCFGTDSMSNPLVKINRTKRLMYRQDYDSEIKSSMDALDQYHQETIQYNPLAF